MFVLVSAWPLRVNGVISQSAVTGKSNCGPHHLFGGPLPRQNLAPSDVRIAAYRQSTTHMWGDSVCVSLRAKSRSFNRKSRFMSLQFASVVCIRMVFFCPLVRAGNAGDGVTLVGPLAAHRPLCCLTVRIPAAFVCFGQPGVDSFGVRPCFVTAHPGRYRECPSFCWSVRSSSLVEVVGGCSGGRWSSMVVALKVA